MKRTLAAIILLLSAGSLFAQQSVLSQYGFRLGLTAHPTIGWVKPQVGKSNGVSLGFSYGLLGDFNFAENYAFATGVTITTVNGRTTEVRELMTETGTAQSEYELKYKMQYIEVPLSVKLRTSKMADVRWYGQFGLSNGFKIGAKQDGNPAGGSDFKNQNISETTKFYRAGLIIGAGGEYDTSGSASLFGGLTYNNGFTDITTDKTNNVRNHYIGINFGVFF